jgi:flagellar biosynthesis chaperone FliJ
MANRITTQRSRIASGPMRLLFALTFVLASLGVFLGGRGDRVLAGAGWAILCMFAYAVIVWVRGRATAETEEFADSFYYLGFLLTLVALIAVLFRLGDMQGQGLLEGVLRNFGIALATTVIGLLGRIVLLMFREVPDDLEESARRRAEDAYETLVHAIDRMAGEAESFGSSFAMRLNTALSPIDPAVEKIIESAGRLAAGLQPLEGRFAELDSTIETSQTRIQAGADSYFEALVSISERGGTAMSDSVAEIQTLLTTLREVPVALESQLQGHQHELARATAGYSMHLEEASTSVNSVAHGLQEVMRQIEELRSDALRSVTSLALETQGLQQSMDSLVQTVSSLARSLAEQGAEINGSLEPWQATIASLQSLQKELVRATRASAEATAEVREDIAAGVSVLVHKLAGEAGPSMEL